MDSLQGSHYAALPDLASNILTLPPLIPWARQCQFSPKYVRTLLLMRIWIPTVLIKLIRDLSRAPSAIQPQLQCHPVPEVRCVI